jgi:catechol 2,3-dioxygenase-like lactoylglutathione lyase family enzyme
MKNPVDLKGFIQLALVVKDIEKTAKTWADFFGVPVPKIAIHEGKGTSDLTYRGSPATYKIKFAALDTGRGFIVELHEPICGESTFQEFLDKHGNGVHHIGFEVGDKRDAIVKEFEESGYAPRTIGYYPGSSWTIVDCEDDLGVNLNIKPKA